MEKLEQFVREVATNQVEGDRAIVGLCEAITDQMLQMQSQILQIQEQIKTIAGQVKTLAEYNFPKGRTH